MSNNQNGNSSKRNKKRRYRKKDYKTSSDYVGLLNTSMFEEIDYVLCVIQKRFIINTDISAPMINFLYGKRNRDDKDPETTGIRTFLEDVSILNDELRNAFYWNLRHNSGGTIKKIKYPPGNMSFFLVGGIFEEYDKFGCDKLVWVPVEDILKSADNENYKIPVESLIFPKTSDVVEADEIMVYKLIPELINNSPSFKSILNGIVVS